LFRPLRDYADRMVTCSQTIGKLDISRRGGRDDVA
jgi:hypothetical protein